MQRLLAAILLVIVTLTPSAVFAQTCNPGSYTVQEVTAAAALAGASLLKHWSGDEIFFLRKQLMVEGADEATVGKIDEMLVYYAPIVSVKVSVFLFNNGCSFLSFMVDSEVYANTVRKIDQMRVNQR